MELKSNSVSKETAETAPENSSSIDSTKDSTKISSRNIARKCAAAKLPSVQTDESPAKELEAALSALSDEELLSEIREKHDNFALEYLIKKYRNFVRVRSRSYFLIGADREDILQEGMIGLYKAIRDFRDEKLSSFRAFAELCVTRQIITAIKTATRQKHIPLNSYISLNKPIYDEDSDRTLLDILSGTAVSDPEELMINREEFLAIEGKMEQILSDLEWKVLMSYLDGKSYQEIAVDLNRHVKSIDNALQRVKRKLEKYMSSRAKAEERPLYKQANSANKHFDDLYFTLNSKNE
ncbi:RNA polymerase sporulation sigma factor SigH [Pectinatus haikarae]|uniref:RNA polymerase sporulation-specific sigma factor n=1 Tax=Pectinatus haikarae TaxID=349096 RepID=A0ABT9Y555_9FIRM|nr:RNA polymerase sporulation sigma factor SigH [Pectinatus haikarae]MDQ0202957.1 RNA polymerase sporulation-specific sigma factor [Pectinatus haikarae]